MSKYSETVNRRTLRERAESLVRQQQQLPNQQSAAVELSEEVISELTIHKIELEMQNRELQEANQQVEMIARHYQSLFEFSPIGLFISDEKGFIVELNSSLAALFALSRDDLLGHAFAHYADEKAEDVFYLHARQVFKQKSPQQVEMALRLPDGSRLETKLISHPYQFPDKSGDHVITAVEDITQRKQQESQLQLAASVFSHVSEGIVISDTNGVILDVNRAFTQITEYSRAEAIGKKSGLLQSIRHSTSFYNDLWQILKTTGEWHGEAWNRKKSGILFFATWHISAVRSPSGAIQRYVALFSDNTRQEAYKEKLERMAHFDLLTGLPNRILLLDRLEQAMAVEKRRKQLVAVAFIDLDGFKEINDEYGHDVGDQILVSLSIRFKETLRTEDTIARLGGDEFVAVFIDLDHQNECIPLIQRLLEHASAPLTIHGEEIYLSSSIGVTFFPQVDNVEPGQLLRQADLAMYQAKLSGKNQFKLFDVEQDRSVRGFYEGRERIRHAFHNNEFVLLYQPKVNMRTGIVIGAEALIRWQHPEKGLLSPTEFLPPIENDPLVVDIENWVISESVKQANEWAKHGLTITVSVNICPRHLEHVSFASVLQTLLAEYPQLPSYTLELEVLETSTLLDVKSVSDTIRACNDFGVSFALDDFGTGYSSLTYLRQLPVQTLKIDQSFVRDMLDDPEDLAILDGVIGLSRAFDKRVIAEGVETAEHCEFLLRLGCELAQGFGIARPMPAAEFEQWVKEWSPLSAWADIQSVHFENHGLLIASIRHTAWLKRINKNLQCGLEVSDFEWADNSRFGAWLEKEGKLLYGDNPHYQALIQAHKTVHQIVNALRGQTTKLAGEPLDSLREKLSTQSMKLLDELRELLV